MVGYRSCGCGLPPEPNSRGRLAVRSASHECHLTALALWCGPGTITSDSVQHRFRPHTPRLTAQASDLCCRDPWARTYPEAPTLVALRTCDISGHRKAPRRATDREHAANPIRSARLQSYTAPTCLWRKAKTIYIPSTRRSAANEKCIEAVPHLVSPLRNGLHVCRHRTAEKGQPRSAHPLHAACGYPGGCEQSRRVTCALRLCATTVCSQTPSSSNSTNPRRSSSI